MEEESAPKDQDTRRYANDNHRTDGDNDADNVPGQEIDRAVLSIAYVVGRQMAKEQFKTLPADNDNTMSDRLT